MLASATFYEHTSKFGGTKVVSAILIRSQVSRRVGSGYMDDWFTVIASDYKLPGDVARQLRDIGFIILQGPVAPAKLAQLAAAYDAAVLGADPTDVSIGSSTTRMTSSIAALTSMDSTSMRRSWGRVVASSVSRSS